jgi:hypothetical protein
MRNQKRYRTQGHQVLVEIRLKTISQLFNSLDPSPFLERDLDDEAVNYIETSVMEHSKNTDIKLVLMLPKEEIPNINKKEIIEAIHNHFDYAEDLQRKKIYQIFKQGRFALLVGLILMGFSMSVSMYFESHANTAISMALREGLIILGWVALWRPIDVFLYSWWPELEKKKYYQKLSRIGVEFKEVTR